MKEGGILEANVRWPGHYHECKLAEGPDFSGKWCYAYYGIITYVSLCNDSILGRFE